MPDLDSEADSTIWIHGDCRERLRACDIGADTDTEVVVAVGVDSLTPVTVLFGVPGSATTCTVLQRQAMASTIGARSNHQETERVTVNNRCHGCFFEPTHTEQRETLADKHERCRSVFGLPPCVLPRAAHVQDSSGRDCSAKFLVWRRLHGPEAEAARAQLLGGAQ